jgi:hypothetical protein
LEEPSTRQTALGEAAPGFAQRLRISDRAEVGQGEVVVFGFACGVGMEGFGVEAVFAAVGRGAALAFGGFGALGFFAVGLGGEDESGGCHVMLFLGLG